MAILTSPTISWGGAEPQSVAALVDSSQIAPANVIVYTGNILSSPAFGQLLDIGGVFIAKALADGRLPTSTASSLYSVSFTYAAAYLKKFMVFNTAANEQRVKVYVRRGGNPLRQIEDITLGLNEAADIIDIGEAILLNAGDEIFATATTTNVVDYYIAGVLETAA